MADREHTPYIVLANVQGRKTAIVLDGLYTILPPQNFPAQAPKEIQYKDERLPLYQAREVIAFYEREERGKGDYQRLYRELLTQVKEAADRITTLKRRVLSQPGDLGLAGWLAPLDRASERVSEVSEQVREAHTRMAEKLRNIRERIETLTKQGETVLAEMEELEQAGAREDADLGDLTASAAQQNQARERFRELARLHEDLENRLISMLFHFGIRLRREENPDDENIKRGEKMLALLQGEDREGIRQEEVDRLLTEFLK